MRPKYLEALLVHMIDNNFPGLIVGSPGIGKTDIMAAACKKANKGKGAELMVMHPVVSDPIDFKGMPYVSDKGADFLPFGELKRLVEAKKPIVCFLDDLGQAPPAVQAAAMQLILARTLNGVKISNFVTFMAATNRKEDKAGVSGILEPVKSRFVSIVHLEPHLDDWTDWAVEHDMPTELIAFIHFRPGLLNDFKPTSEIQNSPCPRTVAAVGRLMKSGIRNDLDKETRSGELEGLETEIYTGAAGQGFASELIAFLSVYRDLPDPHEALANPKKIWDGLKNKENKISVVWALCSAVANIVDRKSMGQFNELLSYMKPEFRIFGMKMAVRWNSDLKKTKEFAEFVSQQQDFI